MAPYERRGVPAQPRPQADTRLPSDQDIKSWIGFSTASASTHSAPKASAATARELQRRSADATEQVHDIPRHGALTPPIPERSPERAYPKDLQIPRLRHKATPRSTSLRDLRAKASEAALRSLYELHTDAYLNSIPEIHEQYKPNHSRNSTKWSLSESSSEEDMKEEPGE